MPDAAFAADLARFGPTAAPFDGSLADAYAYCRRLACRHYENFAVTGCLVPRALRPHFHAVYAYCRWSDDLADEVESPERATELLAWWGDMLERCPFERPTHPVFVALAETIRTFEIPLQPFRDLLTAFRQDQYRSRYETVNELRDYCRGSADPVGRIVLHLFWEFDEENAALSDDVCTGLQWVNFCQDMRRDLDDRNRIYLPRESWAAHGVIDEREFHAPHASPALRACVLAETDRAEKWLKSGAELIPRLPETLARIIDLIVAGGLATCAAIRKVDGDVISARPKLSKLRKAGIVAGVSMRRYFWPSNRRRVVFGPAGQWDVKPCLRRGK